MPGHFVLMFVRGLRVHKLITLINVASLALGLAVFSIAFLYVKQEVSYDREWPNADRIHRMIVEQRGMPGTPDGLSSRIDPRVLPALLDYFPEQIEAASRVVTTPVQVEEAATGFGNALAIVDPAFSDIFAFELVEGSLERVLRTPGLIALSEAWAANLGEQGRIGQRLRLTSIFQTEQEFEVGAIIRVPELAAQQLDLLTVMSEHAAALGQPGASTLPWQDSTGIWLLLRPGESTKAFNARMPLFVEGAGPAFNVALPPDITLSEHLFFRVQPIEEMHLNPMGSETDFITFGSKSKVAIFAAVGVLVLLIGCSNSASLSLANALRRRREVGIRKAAGAGKRVVVLHFLGEAVLLALAAFALAIVLQELLIAPASALLGISGDLRPGFTDAVLLLVIAVGMGLLNGAYPAFVLSEVRPREALRPDTGMGSRRSYRARLLLVGAQFSLAIMFVAGALALYTQLSVARAQPLGYDHRNLLYVSHGMLSTAPGAPVMVNELRTLPGVVDALPLVMVPPNMNLPLSINSFKLITAREAAVEVQATRSMVVEGLLEMLGIPLLAGRMLDTTRDSTTINPDFSAPATDEILINRRAAGALGFDIPEQALDQFIYMRRADGEGRLFDQPLQVVGVVEDNLYSSVHRRPVPEFYSLQPGDYSSLSQLLLRYDPAVAEDIQRRVAQAYEPYEAAPYLEFVESRVDAAFVQERSESRLLLIAAGLALLLSCIGLYGLAAATMARSVKEVGVRKVLGASARQIMLHFLLRFSRPILLASLAAWPVAGWFVLQWIRRFPYALDVAWLPVLFLAASCLVLMVAWVTVGGLTARAASRPPMESLRYE